MDAASSNGATEATRLRLVPRPDEIDHGWKTFANFMAQDVRQNYLVDDILPEAQGGLISGRFKTLKTTIAMDLFFSLATGTPFLGKFSVPAPVPCGLMTGESGAATIIEVGCRVANARGIDLRDGPHLSVERARMTDVRHLERVERDIELHGWKCVGIDPTYLAFAAVGDSASNVFKMGEALEPLTRLIQRTGCSIVLLNHNTKGRMKDVGRFDPPDMAEISMSGFAEWMRFWLLLGHQREWDEQEGRHWLWMRTGGSAGHAGLWGLDVLEGRRSDAGGRRWDVSVKDPGDARQQAQRDRANRQSRNQEHKEQEHQRRVVAALQNANEHKSGRFIRDETRLNPANCSAAIAALVGIGRLDATAIVVRGNPCTGYRLVTP